MTVTEVREVTHASPLGDSDVMPCCGRTPFEVPAYHRMTLDPELVTCACVTSHAPRSGHPPATGAADYVKHVPILLDEVEQLRAIVTSLASVEHSPVDERGQCGL